MNQNLTEEQLKNKIYELENELINLRNQENTSNNENCSKYKKLFQLSVDGIILGSKEALIIDANESICKMLCCEKSFLFVLPTFYPPQHIRP